MAIKRKARRYDEGGMTEEDVRSFAGIPENESNAGMKEAYTKPESKPEPEPTKSVEPSNFKQAFAAARKSGDKTFEFGGKKYTTEMASSKPAKVTDTGDESTRLASRVPKPALKYQSLQDREIEAEAKRRSEGRPFYGDSFLSQGIKAIKERISGNASGERGQGRVLKDARIKADEQKFMGSGMKKGGSVSSASKRADGIATKGKTKGRIC